MRGWEGAASFARVAPGAPQTGNGGENHGPRPRGCVEHDAMAAGAGPYKGSPRRPCTGPWTPSLAIGGSAQSRPITCRAGNALDFFSRRERCDFRRRRLRAPRCARQWGVIASVVPCGERCARRGRARLDAIAGEGARRTPSRTRLVRAFRMAGPWAKALGGLPPTPRPALGDSARRRRGLGATARGRGTRGG
jgi:hypothetical protein